MNLNPYRLVPGDTLGIELLRHDFGLKVLEPRGIFTRLEMTGTELASKIQADCLASDDRRIRKHGSNWIRCLRMARRRIDNPTMSRSALAARSVSDEASFLSVLLSFIQKLLPWLQLVMVFMADSATRNAEAYGMVFPDEQAPAPASKEVIHSPPNDVVKDRIPTTEPGFGLSAWDKSEPY